MGEIYAKVTLIANGKEIRKQLLVDTGATYSWIKSSTLKELGVKLLRT